MFLAASTVGTVGASAAAAANTSGAGTKIQSYNFLNCYQKVLNYTGPHINKLSIGNTPTGRDWKQYSQDIKGGIQNMLKEPVCESITIPGI